MRSERPAPMTLQALRESQRQLWKQKCTFCGADPGAGATDVDLRARVRELEWQIKALEAQLAATRS